MFNPNVSNLNNSNYNNIFNNSRNDDILANKISNINKINKEPLINSFNKNFTNGYNNESKINFESNNNEFNNIVKLIIMKKNKKKSYQALSIKRPPFPHRVIHLLEISNFYQQIIIKINIQNNHLLVISNIPIQ